MDIKLLNNLCKSTQAYYSRFTPASFSTPASAFGFNIAGISLVVVAVRPLPAQALAFALCMMAFALFAPNEPSTPSTPLASASSWHRAELKGSPA